MKTAWSLNRSFTAGFPGILRNFVPNMRTYNGIERPDHTPDMISELKADEVFVFGSNLEGMHGGGAAFAAWKKFGAVTFFQDTVHYAVIQHNNPLLLGFLGQEGFIGLLVRVGSFLFHPGCEFTDFSWDFELEQCLGTNKN